MRIISLLATPNGLEGNTAGLLELVMDGARSAGAEVETVVLPGDTVGPCRDCNACHAEGTCPLPDEFEAIKAKISEADGVVLACPNYISHITAQLKAFIDRCGGVIHLMSFRGKYGASVVTAGGGGAEPVAEYMDRFMLMTGVIPVGSVWATMGATPGGEFSDGTKEKARALGRKLVESCESKAAFPEIEKEQAEFKQRMRMLVAFHKEDRPYEYEYWQEHYGME